MTAKRPHPRLVKITKDGLVPVELPSIPPRERSLEEVEADEIDVLEPQHDPTEVMQDPAEFVEDGEQ